MKKIQIINNHPCVVEVPEKPNYKSYSDKPPSLFFRDMEDYKKHRKLAKDNAVRFKDEKRVRFHLDEIPVEGKLYDCPEGFEIVIEGEYATLKKL